MHRLKRAGVTLVELIVALALFGIVSASIYKTLVANQRTFTAQLERTDVQQNIRAAAGILPGELRELDAGDNDIVAMSATSLTIRAFRQFGVLCSAPVLGGVLTARTFIVRSPLFSAARALTTTDSLLMYYEGDGSRRTDDGWSISTVTATSAVNCPDGRAGIQITGNVTLPAPQVNKAGAIPVGAPLRGFERATYRIYQFTAGPGADNKWYLALENAAGVTPLVGPLSGATGVTFTYLDAAGAVTAVRTSVAQIGVTLRTNSNRNVRLTNGTLGPIADSVSMMIALRNNPRFPAVP